MVTDINRKQRLRRQYVQTAVFCSCAGLFAAFAAAVYFSNQEIDFSDVKQICEGIRDIKGNVLFVCMFIGGMAAAFFDLYQYYGYLRERNSLRDEEKGSAKWGNEEKGGIEKYNRDYLYSPKTAKSVEASVKETQGDTAYGFLCSMLYNQLFDMLYRAGEERMVREHFSRTLRRMGINPEEESGH